MQGRFVELNDELENQWVNKKLDRRLVAGCQRGLIEARAIVPFDTGALHDSIHITQPVKDPTGHSRYLAADTDYAAEQEELNPYLRPVISDVIKGIVEGK